MIWIINSDVQIFQIYGHTTRFPDFRFIGPSSWSLTCQTLPIFRVPKFGVTDLPIFVFTLPDFREIGSKKSAYSKKSGSGTTALANHLVWLVIPSLFSISWEKLEYIWTFDLSWGPIDRFNLAALCNH